MGRTCTVYVPILFLFLLYPDVIIPPPQTQQVMSCPGGCIGGGGQPKTRGHDVLQKRMDAVYNIDQHASLRKSHENPEVQVSRRAYPLNPDGFIRAVRKGGSGGFSKGWMRCCTPHPSRLRKSH